MAEGTKIEWTHRPGTIPATLNALVGCQKVSQGCAHCYAIEVAHIRAGNPLPVIQEKFAGTVKSEGGKRVWTGKVTLTEKALLDPLRRKKPRTYFVNALSDLFYEGVSDEWVDKHFAMFALCPQHTFIVLTKRPERMKAYLQSRARSVEFWETQARAFGYTFKFTGVDGKEHGLCKFPLPNVWLGTSVENQRAADDRLDHLCEIAVEGWQTLISFEPLLGSVDASAWWPFLGKKTWAIVGGESGAGARPMHPDWVRSLRDQCASAGVPFFFKQWGEWAPGAQDADYSRKASAFTRISMSGEQSNDPTKWAACDALFYRIGKKASGHLLDGVEWHQFPGVA